MGLSLSADYWVAFWRRRWPVLSAIFLAITVASIVLAVIDYTDRPWVATTQLFVSVKPVAGASNGNVSSFEAESRQAAIDFSQVISGRSLADGIGQALPGLGLPAATVQSALSGSADNRILTITASTNRMAQSLSICSMAQLQILIHRAAYVGPFESSRTDVSVVSPPTASRQAASHVLLVLLVRVLLAAIVAIAVALIWDYFSLAPRAT